MEYTECIYVVCEEETKERLREAAGAVTHQDPAGEGKGDKHNGKHQSALV